MQLIDVQAQPLGLTPVMPGRPQDVDGTAAVPGYPAVHTQPFQWNIEAVACQHHGQRGGPAFGGLHLQNRGNPHPAFDRLLLTHA